MNKEELWEVMKLPPDVKNECHHCVHSIVDVDDEPCNTCCLGSITGWPSWEWIGNSE